ncbi:PAS and ANTAR domain-containing protein [Mycolicibacterium mengxianglii]|uniref:PAS and ANTAR domain-containing protein n=1 Tax=Mycolicibacterium mengxianglii TaxID=2736649 RepID=UPI0018D04F13|nr:PAS and ANTAR domain-containing protein [Mycolicibacterium mengxianglii]
MLDESSVVQSAAGDSFTDDDRPSTDGQPVRKIDKALVGGAPARVGRFEYHYDDDGWKWSDTVARIHGYEPGKVHPTTELVLSHKHPDDLAKVKGLLQQSKAPFSSRHRILTTSGDERNVVVVGDAVNNEDGRVVATRGFYIDITDSVNAELQQSLTEELEAILAHREIIEQAKGMLMAVYSLTADAAFDVLRWRSQELNIKLWDIAEQLVAEVPSLLNVQPAVRAPVDHYLLTFIRADDH